MDIDAMTIGDFKKLSAVFGGGGKSHSLKVGESVFIRTVTYHYTGKIVAITDSDVVMEDAAWIADSGRFSAALSGGSLSEVEPYPYGVTISREGIIDVSPWRHNLPKDAK